MSRDRSGRWRSVVAELVWPALVLGLGVAGWAQGVPVGVLALGAGLAAAGAVLIRLAGEGRRRWWDWPLVVAARTCLMIGTWILLSAAIGRWDGDLLRAIVVGGGTAVVVAVWELFDEGGPGHPRRQAWRARRPPLRSQDDFGPIRGRVQAWWDREPYRGSRERPFGR